MKKIGIIIAAVLLTLFAAAIAIPVFFKGPLMEKVKQTINKNVNARVDFSDFNLSLIRNFPKVQAEIKGLTVTGKERFENDTLVYIGSVATKLSLADLFKNEGLKISSLSVNKAVINLLATSDGLVNWDIAYPDEAAPDEAEEQESDLVISLQEIIVRDLSLNYKDEASTTLVRLLNADIDAGGEVEGTVTRFTLDGEIGEFILEYDSVQYIANTVLKAKSELMADYDKMIFTFGQSTLYLNELPLDVSGRFEMPSDSMYFDIQFKQPKSDFETLLAMVPKSYQSYLEQIKTSGEAGFEGEIKGWFYEEDYPAINTRMYIKNASLQYTGAPEKIEQISLESSISKPQGDLDLLSIHVSEAQAKIRENPVNMKLTLTHPMTDPEFDASFNGKIDFTRLADVIPMDSVELKGFMDGQLAVKGKMSAIEKQDYTQISSNGVFNFRDFLINTPQLTRPVEISSGSVRINNAEINLTSLAAKTGQSDFQLTGKLSNYLPYFLMNKTLQGDFNLKSNYMNFDELAGLMADSGEPTAAADSMVAFQVPGNLDMAFRSQINRASFDRMEIKNIDGVIRVKNQVLELQKLNMEMLQGQLTVDGSYKSNPENKPEFDFNLVINSFQIPAAYQSFSTMQRYMPIASRSQGDISSQIKFKGQFDEKLNIIASSLNGNGFLNTQNLQIMDSPTFDQIRNFIKKEKLKNVKIDDFTAHFQLENGNVLMNPFQTRIADQDVSIYGNVSVNRTLSLNMDFKVNKEDLSGDIEKALGFLPGSENIKILDVSVLVKGELTKPEVALDLSKARQQITEEVKKSTKEQINKSVKKVGDELKKLFN
ncbi:AsmA family protein [Gaoshiqia sp. Z1-71]|uniref:AsmA family protein n=1 Tax=Gaoshiqia hydrogeniformans TaxID=3290090 RepID=UPI003BF8DD58